MLWCHENDSGSSGEQGKQRKTTRFRPPPRREAPPQRVVSLTPRNPAELQGLRGLVCQGMWAGRGDPGPAGCSALAHAVTQPAPSRCPPGLGKGFLEKLRRAVGPAA